MRIHKPQLSEVPADRKFENNKTADVPYNASDPLAEILETVNHLQDGEILRIVPTQRGGECNG